jgi:putative toxin-antitoxin system antitoxin component (TIGR02293 family)
MAKTRKLDYSEDNPRLVAKVEDGIPVLDIVAFGREVGFTTEELAKLIQVPSRTYARRVAGKSRLKIDEGERAVRIMRLYDRARKVFGTNDRTRRWLNRPLRILGGRTPIDYARTEPGAREVEAVLGRFEQGVFS